MQLLSGVEAIKVAVCNAYGLDKLTWNERIEWFDTIGFSNMEKHYRDAGEQAMFVAACQAYNDMVINKRDSGFGIMLDATSSAMQLLSAFVGDKQGAIISNIIALEGEDKRYDGYTFIYDVLQELYPDAESYSRDDLKRAIMTLN